MTVGKSEFIRLRRPPAAYPGFIPVDGPPWRCISPDGSMLQDEDGYILRFWTDDDVLAWMVGHSIPLMKPRKHS